MSNPTKYVFNHTMIRVKDPKASLKFYQDVLGMKYVSLSFSRLYCVEILTVQLGSLPLQRMKLESSLFISLLM